MSRSVMGPIHGQDQSPRAWVNRRDTTHINPTAWVCVDRPCTTNIVELLKDFERDASVLSHELYGKADA